MGSFTEIIVQASKLGTVDEMREFMYEQASQLYEDNDEVSEELVEGMISAALKLMAPEQFDDEEATELLSTIEVPKKKNEKFAAAANFSKEYLTKYETRDTSLFIRMELKTYFSLSVAECDLIIQKIEKDRAKLGLKDKNGIVSMISALDKPASVEIADDVNSEVMYEWSQYCVPSLDNGYYTINSAGIVRVEEKTDSDGEVVEKTIEVCRSPFVLCGKSTPIHGNTTFYKIRFATSAGEVCEAWIEHSHLLTKKGITEKLVSLSINCPENNLQRETIDYISRSIAEFGQHFKTEFSSTQCGWSEDKTRFMLGDRVVTEDSVEPMLPVGNPVGFNATKKSGTLEAWIDTTRKVLECDIVRFKAYDAATAPLVYLLGLESHVTDTWGTSSEGKTFSSLIGLSIFGSTANNDSLVLSQESTKNGVLVTIRDYSDIPLLFDETTGKEDKLKELVYQVASGLSKTKSTQDGKRCGSESYRTTLFLTGENTLRDSLDNAGQMYRVIELAFDKEMPKYDPGYVDSVKKGLNANCGHVADLYVQKLIQKNSDGTLENMLNECLSSLPATESNIDGRSKVLFAGIMVAGKVLEEVFSEIGVSSKDAEEIVNKYYKKCITQNPIELEYIRALRTVLNTISTEYKNFALCNNKEVVSNDGSKKFGYVDDDYIDIYGTALTDILKRNGFKPTKIKESWAKLNVIAPKDKSGNYRFYRFGEQEPGVRIFRKKAEELLGLKKRSIKSDPPKLDEIAVVLETVKFLTKVRGQADLDLINQIVDNIAVESVINDLIHEGRVIQSSKNVYKSS